MTGTARRSGGALAHCVLSASRHRLVSAGRQLIFSILVLLTTVLFVLNCIYQVMGEGGRVRRRLRRVARRRDLHPRGIALTFRRIRGGFFRSRCFVGLRGHVVTNRILGPGS